MPAQHDDSRTSQLVWRGILNWSDKVLLSVGVLVVLGPIVLMTHIIGQLLVATLGILIVEASMRRILSRHLVNQRKHLVLRTEVDHFLTLVRQLNTAALKLKEGEPPEARQAFEHVRQTMQESVERMATLAGKTNADLVMEAEACIARDSHATSTPGDETDRDHTSEATVATTAHGSVK